ncbi:MAG: hypothetical protein OHK0046_18500 [Anaerolineae bacterium]
MQKTVAITVDRPVEEMYAFWRDFSNYPRLIDPLDTVVVQNGTVHWQATLPGDIDLSWESQVVEDRPYDAIVWRSPEGAALRNEGEITFRPAPAGRGVEVRFTLNLDPPGGEMGEAVAKLFGPVPHVLAYKALYRFKCLMETGEIPTLDNQPAAREGGQDE